MSVIEIGNHGFIIERIRDDSWAPCFLGRNGEDAAYSLMHFEPGEEIPHDRSDSNHYE